MRILVISECEKGVLVPTTLNTITAAQQIGGEVDVLVAGHDCSGLAESMSGVSGVARVLCCEHADLENHITENLAGLIESLSKDYTHVMAAATTFGKALIPYVAALCDAQAISDISDVIDADTFVRPIYAGNALATVKSSDSIKMITVRATSFESASTEGGNAAVENVEATGANQNVHFIEQMLSLSERPELTSAKVVVSGGRGMKDGKNFEMLETLADKLGGAVGASRAAVDAGFVPNDYQVGQTGKVVAPDLYVAVGISGAIQHLAGMKDSKIIVAINTDEDAPIFQVSDYGWNEDLFIAIPELNDEIEPEM
ncbi:MAG: electron transfer flavoprotein subunit alpha/FixB family protein [Gammaproteobacteria bacterium]|nr:electron transfer flavoprotein subunit alpha/FixB family protein [Gammaproteobacteria bacterium]